MKHINAKAFLIRHHKLAMDIVVEMDILTPAQRTQKATLLQIKYKFNWLKKHYGHEPLLPANQYCKHCGIAFFTGEWKTPCLTQEK